MEYDKELATRLNMLDPDEIKKRQEELKNQKKKMKDLKIFANNVEDADSLKSFEQQQKMNTSTICPSVLCPTLTRAKVL